MNEPADRSDLERIARTLSSIQADLHSMSDNIANALDRFERRLTINVTIITAVSVLFFWLVLSP
ncbi:MAG: hypothetical protein JWM58_1036 [Rhizobium sp.]|nr:hypothetical protein [Rhizobium sp.]